VKSGYQHYANIPNRSAAEEAQDEDETAGPEKGWFAFQAGFK
jgi:hypothetical protein